MKNYKLILNGLNCAHCASVIENKIIDSKKYDKVSFNFATKTLRLNSSDGEAEIIDEIQKIVDSVEDGVTVSSSRSEENESKMPLIIGTGLFILSVLIPLIFSGNLYLSSTLTLMLQIAAVIIAGFDIFLKGIKSLFHLKADENSLLTIAVIAAFCIGEAFEAVLVTLLFALGEIIEDIAVGKSRKSIEKLASIKPDSANIKVNNEYRRIPADEVPIGSIISVAPHERIPIDGVVTSGISFVDASAITGESVPVEAKEGCELLSGVMNGDGILELRTTKKHSDSAASRIIKIVEEAAAAKGNSEKFITKFARVYTPIVILISILVIALGTLFNFGTFSEMLYRGLVILVASCPCAIVISVPLAFYSGIGAASKKGILIKGSKFIEILAKADCIAFDKTGTLTKGVFTLKDIKTFGGTDKDFALSLAASAEKHSAHPMAKAIKNIAPDIDLPELINYNETAGKGIKAEYNGKTVLCGNKSFLEGNGINCYDDFSCMLALDGKLIAGFTFSDVIREDSKSIIKSLKQLGFKKIAMLTGDKKKYAEEIAGLCGIDEVYSDLLPEDKVSVMKKLNDGCKKSVFVGDGINDAPLLANADCGMAMGLGSEAAIEAADTVLSDGTVKKLPDCIKLVRKVMKVIKFNIAFAVAFKAFVLILAVFGFAPIWLAVVADTGISLICTTNSALIIK